MKKILYLLLLLPLCLQAQQIVTTEADQLQTGKDGRYYLKGQSRPFTGLRLAYYASGGLESEVSLVNGIKDGPSREFFEDGTLAIEASFNNGKEHGITTAYDDNGLIFSSDTYLNGVLNGVSQGFFEDGTLELEMYFVNGVANGPMVQNFPNGNPMCVMNFKNGQLDGLMVVYNEEGGYVETESEFLFGKENGYVRHYYSDGQMQSEALYRNGVQVGEANIFEKE